MTQTFDQQLEAVLRMHLPGAEGDQPLPIDKPLAQLGLDSLRAVSLVLDLEDTFKVEFPDNLLSEAAFETGRSIRETVLAVLPTHDGADVP